MGRFGNHFHGQVANTADMLLFKNVKRKFKKEEDSVSGKRTVHTVFPHSFLNLEMQRSQYIRPKVTVHRGAETIQGRKLFKGGNYMRKYGNSIANYA